MKNKKEYTLTVEFINRKLIGKRIEKSLSGKRFSYKGKTKRECIWKAKLAGRYNSCYTKEWALVNNN